MRRRRLPARRSTGASTSRSLVPAGSLALARYEPTSDLRYLEQVVVIRFPILAAMEYLQRSMGNRITYRLVEAQRGESVGLVREVEIHHSNSGERTFIRGQRVLANGEPASFYVPDHLVTIRPFVEGAARRSMSLSTEDEVILHVPVRGYLRFLPAIFQGEGPVHAQEIVRARSTELARWRGGELPPEQVTDIERDEDPMRRFLFIFQHVMTSLTNRIDRLVDLTDPMMCEPKMLPWLSSWVGFELDESLPVHQQRELVRRAIRLMRTRGTRIGIEDMVRVLTSAPVRVEERVSPKAMVVGKVVLIGGTNVVERYQRAEPPGSYLMDAYHPAIGDAPSSGRKPTSFFTLRLEPRDRFQNRFGERAAQVLRRIVNVVSQEKPSHISFIIRFDDRR